MMNVVCRWKSNVLMSIVLYALSLGVCFAGNIWYVDPDHGDDTYDGKQLAVDAQAKKGPKKHLAWFVAANGLGNGDVIYAAKGHYAEDAVTTGGRQYRCVLNAANVRLISLAGAAETFIDGTMQSGVLQDADPWGCGPDAVTPVLMTAGCVVQGFTIANGRINDASDKYTVGGGVYGSGSNETLVDCVITNCWSSRGGGAGNVENVIRCRFINNRAFWNEGAHATDIKVAYNCIFDGAPTYGVYNSSGSGAVFVNCLGRNNKRGTLRSSSANGRIGVYNSAFYVSTDNSNTQYCDYYNCRFDFDPLMKSATGTTNGECRVVSTAELQASLLDSGVGSYYDDNYPAALADWNANLDLERKVRVMGAAIDVGPVEHDWYADYAQAIANFNVAVTNATSGIRLADEGGIVVPSGNLIDVAWAFEPGSVGNFNFKVVVTGAGTLCVYRDDEAEPMKTVAASASGMQTFTATGDHVYRFSMVGEGTATLSEFHNCAEVTVSDELGDLIPIGCEIGVSTVVTGTKTFSFERSGASARACLGVNVDGVYHKFAYADADDLQSFEMAAESGCHVIRAVYAESTGVYFDPVRGDNGNDGLATFRAKKDLGAFAKSAAVGSVLYALPGVYSNEEFSVNSQLYRLDIPDGVSVRAVEGADTTVIDGFKDGGNIACVYVRHGTNGGLALQGFTIRNGSASYGGGVSGVNNMRGIVADCVISNCVAKRGGAGHNVGGFVRCRFYDNHATDNIAASLYEIKDVLNCYFKGSQSYEVYNVSALELGSKIVNCTFDNPKGGPHAASGEKPQHVYDSIVLADNDPGGCYYHNCILTCAPLETGAYSTKDAATVVTNKDAVLLTLEGLRPVVGHNPAVGKGDAASYAANTAGLAAYAGTDLWGNARLRAGVLDVGAVACDRGAMSTIDSPTGLTVSGVPCDGNWHDAAVGANYTVSRNNTGHYVCVGFYVGSEYVSFEGHEEDWTYTGAYPASGTLTLKAKYATSKDWYVDATNGNDGNDGERPGVGHAFRTLAAAMQNPGLWPGDVIHAAPGVYEEGEMAPVDDSTSNRVVVAGGVGLVADGGRDVTIIEGKAASTTSGVGEDAIRCCYVRSGGYIRGFTLQNGYVNDGTMVHYDCGGGVRGDGTDSCVVECEIRNCKAIRGGGAFNVGLLRSYVHDCTQGSDRTDRSYACDTMTSCRATDSIVSGQIYLCSTLVNCTLNGQVWGSSTACYNCFVLKDASTSAGNRVQYHNCVTSGTFNRSFDGAAVDSDCREGVAVTFDDRWSPVSRTSALVDVGSNEYYVAQFPSAFDRFGRGTTDAMGGQRVYNAGRIDIGGIEYDWRSDFARAIKTGRYTVESADAMVEWSDDGVVLSEGCSLTSVLTARQEGAIFLSIGGDVSNLRFSLNGQEVSLSEGSNRLQVSQGANELDFEYRGATNAKIGRIRTDSGIVIFVR